MSFSDEQKIIDSVIECAQRNQIGKDSVMAGMASVLCSAMRASGDEVFTLADKSTGECLMISRLYK